MSDLRKFISTTIKEYLNEQSNVLLAPNGKPSNLPKNLYEYVRTDDFKKWFGDWETNPNNSSRIVDENGEPMLVYHGTKIKFNQFDLDKQKIGWLGKGFYFTNDKGATKEYGKSTMKIFLNIRNTFIVKGESPNDVYSEIKNKFNIQRQEDIDTDVSIILKANGYDGVIFNHWDKGNMISCFNPSQIKILN